MTPEQALEILVKLAAMANAPLQAHINAQHAAEILKKELSKNEKAFKPVGK